MAALLEWDTLNDMDEPYTPPGGLVVKDQHGTILYHPSTTLSPTDAGHIVPLAGNTKPLIKFLDFVH